MNYFDYYGLPLSFQLDIAALRRVFLQKSKQFHPDFHTLADATQQAEAMRQSAFNNEAWSTLSDPDRRMRYLLTLKGTLGDARQEQVPQDFLMDIMALNEAIMELEFEPNDTQIAQISASVDALAADLWADIQPILSAWEDTPEHVDALHTVRDFYLKKRYLERLREKLATLSA